MYNMSDESENTNMQTDLLNSFNSTLKEFLDELSEQSQELQAVISERYAVIDIDSDTYMKEFLENCNANFLQVCSKDESIFDTEFYILPDVNISGLFSQNKESIWKYLHTLFLITTSCNMKEQNLQSFLENISENENNEETAALLKMIENLTKSMMENTEDGEGKEGGEGEEGEGEGEEGGEGDEDDSDDSEEGEEGEDGNPLEDFPNIINNTKIGKLAQEISEEIDLEDFVNISHADGNPESMNHNDILQKILGKNPQKIMNMVKHIGDKMKNKFESGELNEGELVEEVQSMMGKFQNNKKFKKAFKSKQMQGMMQNLTKMMGDPSGDGASPEQMSELFENMMRTGGNPMQKAQTASTRDRLRNKLLERQAAVEKPELEETVADQSVAVNDDDWIPKETSAGGGGGGGGKRHRKKKIKKKPPIPTL